MTAGLSTATARLGTSLTVVVVMLLALSGTAIARFCTHTAQLSMKVRIARHKPSTDGARIRTIAAELNALSHHLHHVAVQTGCGAVFAVS